MATRENPIMILADIESRSKCPTELLDRLNHYGRAFRTSVKTDDAKLLIFATYWSKSLEVELKKKYEYLEIYPVRSRVWRIVRQTRLLIRLIKSQGGGSRFLIAGDPIAGFLITSIAKLMSFGRHVVQVQFHGDIYLRPPTINPKEYLRWILARIQFRIADSVRVVSQHQYDDLMKISPNRARNVFIAPVPIDSMYFSADLTKSRMSIGFIGRLHVERGVDMLRQIISSLLVQYPGIKILIIGDGPEKKGLDQEFRNELAIGTISLLGWLNKSSVLKELEEMKILISTAPTEGYGLAIREAVLTGVHVLARSNKAAYSAGKDFPEHVTIYSDAISAVLAIGKLLNVEISKEATVLARLHQLEKDSLAIRTLVRTWG